MKTEKLFISFAVKIDETVRFSCRTTSNNNIADKEIFRVNGYYFFTSLTVPKRSTPIRCAKLPKKNFTPVAANF